MPRKKQRKKSHQPRKYVRKSGERRVVAYGEPRKDITVEEVVGLVMKLGRQLQAESNGSCPPQISEDKR